MLTNRALHSVLLAHKHSHLTLQKNKLTYSKCACWAAANHYLHALFGDMCPIQFLTSLKSSFGWTNDTKSQKIPVHTKRWKVVYTWFSLQFSAEVLGNCHIIYFTFLTLTGQNDEQIVGNDNHQKKVTSFSTAVQLKQSKNQLSTGN